MTILRRCSLLLLLCLSLSLHAYPPVVLLGPPLSGKGTLGQSLSERLSIPHISVGDLLREKSQDGSTLGTQMKEIMDRGELLSDALVIEAVRERLQRSDCSNGYFLDGFPRTIGQADALARIVPVPAELVVIQLEARDSVLIDRGSSRRICNACGRSISLKINPPRETGICDFCGGKLIRRSDDNEEVIANRLKTYHEKTAPLVNYYRERGVLHPINAEGSMEESIQAAVDILQRLSSRRVMMRYGANVA